MRGDSVCFCDFDIGQSLNSPDFSDVAFPFRVSIHTWAPYDRMGSIAPEYTIRSMSCRSPQLSLANFDRA